MNKKKHKKFRRHDDMRGFSGKDYIASHGKRQHYKLDREWDWTPQKRKLYRTGCKLIEEGIRVEVVIGVIKEVTNV